MPKPHKSPILFFGIIIVLLIVVIAVYYGASGSNNVQGGGPGQSYLSKNEMESLFGPGLYYATGSAYENAAGARISSTSNLSGYLHNNVTAAWFTTYTVSGLVIPGLNGTQKGYVVELLYQSPVAKYIYRKEIESMGSSFFNVTNATSDGLTYSYYVHPSDFHTTILVMWKNNETGEMSMTVGKNVSMRSLAATLAKDLP